MRRPAATLLACLLPLAAHAATQDFTLVNRTGYPIDNIYVAEIGNPGWGNNVMGRDTLYPGERVDISFDRNTRVCRWNVMVRYHDDTRAVWTNLNICEISRFALFWDRLSLQTIARAE